jgi:hypothetical protein
MNCRFKCSMLTIALTCISGNIPLFAKVDYDSYNKAGIEAYKHAKYGDAEFFSCLH